MELASCLVLCLFGRALPRNCCFWGQGPKGHVFLTLLCKAGKSCVISHKTYTQQTRIVLSDDNQLFYLIRVAAVQVPGDVQDLPGPAQGVCPRGGVHHSHMHPVHRRPNRLRVCERVLKRERQFIVTARLSRRACCACCAALPRALLEEFQGEEFGK